MISRKFLGVGMQHIVSRPSRSIRNLSHYCFSQKKSISIVTGKNRYFFSGVPGSGSKGDQPTKQILNMAQLSSYVKGNSNTDQKILREHIKLESPQVEPELKQFYQIVCKTEVEINENLTSFYQLTKSKGIDFDADALSLYSACVSKGVEINEDLLTFFKLCKQKRINFDSYVLSLYTACTSQGMQSTTEDLQFYRYVYQERQSFAPVLDQYLIHKKENKLPNVVTLKDYRQARRLSIYMSQAVNQTLEVIQKRNEAKDEKKKTKIDWGVIFAAISSLIGAGAVYIAQTSKLSNERINEQNIKNSPLQRKKQQQHLQSERKNKLKRMYGAQEFEFLGEIEENTDIKNQINDIFEEHKKQIEEYRKNNFKDEGVLAFRTLKFEIITGISGSGKSTAIKQLVKLYRSQKKQVYYISFKDSESPTAQEVIAKFKIVKQIILDVCKNAKLDEAPIIILDDINQLSLIKDDKLKQREIHDFLSATYQWRVKVFGVSSSSQFSLDFKDYPKGKSVSRVLQSLSQSDRRKILASIIKLNVGINEAKPEILNYMISKGYLPRTAQSRFQNLAPENQGESKQIQQQNKITKEVIEKLKNLDEIQEKDKVQKLKAIFAKLKGFSVLKKGINSSLSEKEESEFRKFVLELILKQSCQKLNGQNCRRIYDQIGLKGINWGDKTMKQFFKDLDTDNLIVYCQPRSKLDWHAFARYLRESYGVEHLDYEQILREEKEKAKAKTEANSRL